MRLFWISTKLLKHMVGKPATRMYPKIARAYIDKTRGQIGIDIDKCIFCGFCMRKCPTGAIVVAKPEKHWGISRLKCIQCNSCVEVCPVKCLTMLAPYTPPSTGKIEDDFYARVPDNGKDNTDGGSARVEPQGASILRFGEDRREFR